MNILLIPTLSGKANNNAQAKEFKKYKENLTGAKPSV